MLESVTDFFSSITLQQCAPLASGLCDHLRGKSRYCFIGSRQIAGYVFQEIT